VGIASFSAVGSLLAGLGYHASADAGPSVIGIGIPGVNADATMNVLPIVSIGLLAFGTWWVHRGMASVVPVDTRGAVVRSTVSALVTGVSIFAIAQVTSPQPSADASGLVGLLGNLSSFASVFNASYSVSMGPNPGALPLLLVVLGMAAFAGEGGLGKVLRRPSWMSPLAAAGAGLAGVAALAAILLVLGGIGALLFGRISALELVFGLLLLPNLLLAAVAGGAGFSFESATGSGSVYVIGLDSFAGPVGLIIILAVMMLAGVVGVVLTSRGGQAARTSPVALLLTAVAAVGIALVAGTLTSASAAYGVGVPLADAFGSLVTTSSSASGTWGVHPIVGPGVLVALVGFFGGSLLANRFGQRLQSVAGSAFGRASATAADTRRQVASSYARGGVRGIGSDTLARWMRLRRRTQLAALAGVMVLVASVVVGVAINSPGFQLSSAVQEVARRELSGAVDSQELAVAMGVAGAPSNVTFSLSGWNLIEDEGLFNADWDLVAMRGDTQLVTQHQAAIFSHWEGGTFWLDSFTGAVPLSTLVDGSTIRSQADAEALLQDVQAANAALGVQISLARRDVAVPAAGVTVVEEPSWLIGEEETISEATDGTDTVWSLAVSNGQAMDLVTTHLLASGPAVVKQGTLDPGLVLESAARTLDSLRSAQESGDVASGRGLLTGAPGLQLSGFAAAVLPTATAGDMELQGNRVDGYTVRMPDGQVMSPARAGAYLDDWKLDYSGMPLVHLETLPATFTGSRDARSSTVTVWVVVEAVADDLDWDGMQVARLTYHYRRSGDDSGDLFLTPIINGQEKNRWGNAFFDAFTEDEGESDTYGYSLDAGATLDSLVVNVDAGSSSWDWHWSPSEAALGVPAET
jgi:hypothetical protein